MAIVKSIRKIYNINKTDGQVTIILTNHAKKRMVERAISFKHVQETIEMPNYTVQKGKKTEAYKKYDERRIKVVYVAKDKYIKVISVM